VKAVSAGCAIAHDGEPTRAVALHVDRQVGEVADLARAPASRLIADRRLPALDAVDDLAGAALGLGPPGGARRERCDGRPGGAAMHEERRFDDLTLPAG
jgi:hypothetical protein